ncbi:hypothetical protein MalM25_35060 [Planctomycetes bacterium MalM25]|nr:hypothetical protein MalM25_35060 [Planctomycetes bacterium MalM25]
MELQLGWTPDLPDPRDRLYTPSGQSPHPTACFLEEEERPLWRPATSKQDISPAVSILATADWISRHRRGQRLAGSADFLAARSQDTPSSKPAIGSGLRDTLKALRRFGAPPEPAEAAAPSTGDCDPSGFAYASEYAGIRFLRIDGPKGSPQATLVAVREWLLGGSPCVCGFAVLDSVGKGPLIPYTPDRSAVVGGTAAVVMGFDDSLRVDPSSRAATGALRVRCCWGVDWGDSGYGWLPYQFLTERLARDFWGVRLEPDGGPSP